jgi:octaprenyl-diphosphate synthase
MKEINKLLFDIKPEIEKIDQIILDFSSTKSPLIKEISSYLIKSGGKRIRPIILILSAKLCGSEKSDSYSNLAAAVELIHTATLLHDDVVDNSLIRRGKKTPNSIWDNKASILVGDYLFSIAFQLMVKSNDLQILDLLAKASSSMADGEVMQLENSNDIKISEEKYYQIIFGKTAVLFSAACESGALLNKKSENEILALKNFGKNLGLVFQMVDDILDYKANENDLGKELGKDFFESKATIPSIILYHQAEEKDKKRIEEIFAQNLLNQENDQKLFEEILVMMDKYSVFQITQKKVKNFYDLAISDLEIFNNLNQNQKKAHFDLLTILKYSMDRIH